MKTTTAASIIGIIFYAVTASTSFAFEQGKNMEDAIMMHTESDTIKADSLIEGRTYSVRELNSNTEIKTRKFYVTGYVVNIYKVPLCPANAQCKPSMSPNVTISDNSVIRPDFTNMTESDAVLYLKKENYDSLEVGKKYTFYVEVINAGDTNKTSNQFELVSTGQSDSDDDTDESFSASNSASAFNIDSKTEPAAKTTMWKSFWSWITNFFT